MTRAVLAWSSAHLHQLAVTCSACIRAGQQAKQTLGAQRAQQQPCYLQCSREVAGVELTFARSTQPSEYSVIAGHLAASSAGRRLWRHMHVVCSVRLALEGRARAEELWDAARARICEYAFRTSHHAHGGKLQFVILSLAVCTLMKTHHRWAAVCTCRSFPLADVVPNGPTTMRGCTVMQDRSG